MTDETTPTSSEQDDVEAHAAGFRGSPAQPAEVEAHGLRGRAHDEDIPTGKEPTERESADEGDTPDVESHAMRGK